MASYTIRDMPVEEQPRERLLRYGASNLSNSELLAIVVRVGAPGENVLRMCERLLAHCGGLQGIARATLSELQEVGGMGEVKAGQVKAALELGRRLLATSPDEKPQIKSPADAVNLLMSNMALLEQEHLQVLLLDTRNRVIAIKTIYQGSLNSSVVRIAELFRPAIKINAAAIIIAHNHPSGDPTPSPEDVRVTRQVVEAGKLLDIELLDHLIIGNNRYVSLKERALGF